MNRPGIGRTFESRTLSGCFRGWLVPPLGRKEPVSGNRPTDRNRCIPVNRYGAPKDPLQRLAPCC